MQPINWAHVVATAFSLTLLGAGALYMTTYAPKPFSEDELAATHRRNLANCGAGMFDVVPHHAKCPRFEAIGLQLEPCLPACDAFAFTLHADGRAELEVTAPENERGRFTARVGKEQYRELGNLIAYMKLDRRGGHEPLAVGESGYTVRAGCDGEWTVLANYGGAPGEIEAVTQCLLDFREQADWE